MNPHHFLGVDGGGTRTRALLVDAAGRCLGRGEAASTNRNHFPPDRVRDHLRDAAAGALRAGRVDPGGVRSAFLGMSGVSTEADAAWVAGLARELPELPPGVVLAVDNDAVAGLRGGLSGRPGVALISGTGSACLGIDARGRRRWCGGWGAQVDDCGSGYWLAIRAFESAVRAEDGRGPATVLRREAFDFLDLPEPRAFLDRTMNAGLSRDRIAAFAPRVIDAARRGDAVAHAILRRGAGELSLLVSTVAADLFADGDFEAVFVGGVARSGPPYQAMVAERIGRGVPGARVVEPEMSPAQGAALEAMRLVGVVPDAQALAALRESFEACCEVRT